MDFGVAWGTRGRESHGQNNTGNGPFGGDGFCIAPAPMFLLCVPFPARLPSASLSLPRILSARHTLRRHVNIDICTILCTSATNGFACHPRVIPLSSNEDTFRMISKCEWAERYFFSISILFFILEKILLCIKYDKILCLKERVATVDCRSFLRLYFLESKILRVSYLSFLQRTYCNIIIDLFFRQLSLNT